MSLSGVFTGEGNSRVASNGGKQADVLHRGDAWASANRILGKLRAAIAVASAIGVASLIGGGLCLASDGSYGYGAYPHKDGNGITYRNGYQMREEYADGRWVEHRRDGSWEYIQHSNGVAIANFYDDVREVRKFDVRDPNAGTREIGEVPYPSNPYGVSWSKYVPTY